MKINWDVFFCCNWENDFSFFQELILLKLSSEMCDLFFLLKQGESQWIIRLGPKGLWKKSDRHKRHEPTGDMDDRGLTIMNNFENFKFPLHFLTPLNWNFLYGLGPKFEPLNYKIRNMIILRESTYPPPSTYSQFPT